MRVLVWTPPWVGQGGDLFFFSNAFKKHLLAQANTLAEAGWDVTAAFPDIYQYELGAVSPRVKLAPLPAIEAIGAVGAWEDPSRALYRDGEASELSRGLARWLEGRLPEAVDIVLLWETPAPYLKTLYPDALIVHQMPGAFSRAPYPHLVTFDPNGLYRTGTINRCAEDFAGTGADEAGPGAQFAAACRALYSNYPARLSREFEDARAGRKTTLLPLQISGHYAFQEETGYHSQAEYCLDALSRLPAENAVLITQYISRLYSDKPITPEFYRHIKEKFPNACYDFELEKLPSASQYLLQEVDEIVAATTALSVQALAWDLPIRVFKDTHLAVLDESRLNRTDQRLGVLSNVLDKLQPLARLVTEDKAFLAALLEELHARRHAPPAERLVSYRSIDPDYFDTVMGAFREDELPVRRLAPGAGAAAPAAQSPDAQLAEALAAADIALVSFDLFDTLIFRNIEAPADLYAFLEMRLRQKGFAVPFEFAQKRLDAELQARSLATGEEIELRDIYRCLQEETGVPDSLLDAFYKEEVEIEVDFCAPRPVGQKLWEAAKKAGPRICVTSDMYLPETCIRRILDKCGFGDFETLYLSSSLGATKKHGTLFKHIAKETGLEPGKILHVGDTVKTDITPAKEAGLETLHLPKSIEHFRQNDFLASAYAKRGAIAEADRSAIVGTVACRLFGEGRASEEDSAFNGDPWAMGYACIGPMLLGFSQWLRRQSAQHDVRMLHFLSREGLIMKKAFDRLQAVAPTGVGSNYLYGSRRAIRIANLATRQDITELLNQTIDVNATVAALMEGRFGAPASALTPAVLREAGVSSAEAMIRTLPDYKAKLYKICAALSDEILENAAEERKLYLEYLTENGFDNPQETALVDIGWSGNMQGALGRLLETPLRGYYFATLSSAHKWSVQGQNLHGYFAEFCANPVSMPILNYRLLLEDMLCDITPSVVRVEKGEDGAFRPVFKDRQEDADRIAAVAPLQEGALKFVDDVCAQFGPLVADMELRPDLTTAFLSAFVNRPRPEDARIFMGRRLDDAFSGSVGRYLLAPDAKGGANPKNSYWRAGAAAFAEPPAPAGAGFLAGDDTLEHQPFLSRLVLKIAYALLKDRFTDYQRRLYKDAPRELFRNFSNPLLVGLGRIAGVR
ncbi:HAD family hydrolase [Hyphococcus luteus]|uniref:Uncharacterized protein n=1 Tax=Hyphococcus luteus TaxID=2058213 RepID=A0A2S7K7T9_9PROT|nr:HAD-IA family hydrolase [Marinicaulis flavus]PQA88552.1 hypothetical protein CW354_09730 [Marinicaulis flavus]